MTIRCKFECQEITKRKGWSGHKMLYDAKLTAVMQESEENKVFFAATPSGTLTVATVVPDIFEVGKSYYLDITPAD